MARSLLGSVRFGSASPPTGFRLRRLKRGLHSAKSGLELGQRGLYAIPAVGTRVRMELRRGFLHGAGDDDEVPQAEQPRFACERVHLAGEHEGTVTFDVLRGSKTLGNSLFGGLRKSRKKLTLEVCEHLFRLPANGRVHERNELFEARALRDESSGLRRLRSLG